MVIICGSGPGSWVQASNLPVNDPNFENWGDRELKRWCRLQEVGGHREMGQGYLRLTAFSSNIQTPKVTLRELMGRDVEAHESSDGMLLVFGCHFQ